MGSLIKTPIILTSILVVLTSYYFIDDINQEKLNKKEEQSKKITSISYNDINSIEYKNKNNLTNIVLYQKGNDWMLSNPISYKADNSTVFSFSDSILNSSFSEKIESKNLEEFGLKNPKITIKFKSKKDDLNFKIGDKSPTQDSFYIMKNTDPNIYLLPSSIFYSLDKKMNDFRDKKIAYFEKSKIDKIKISTSDNNFTLIKDNENWNITEPKKVKADLSKVDDLLYSSINTNVTDFVDDTKDLKKFSLDKPKSILSFESTKDKTNFKIFVGNDDGLYSYIKNKDISSVFKVEKSFSEKLKLSLDDLRDKTLLSFISSDISKIYLESKKGKLIVEKDSNKKWNIKSKIISSTKEEDITSFIDKLSNLNFEKSLNKINGSSENIKISLEKNNKQKINFNLNFDKENKIYFSSKESKEFYLIDNMLGNNIL